MGAKIEIFKFRDSLCQPVYKLIGFYSAGGNIKLFYIRFKEKITKAIASLLCQHSIGKPGVTQSEINFYFSAFSAYCFFEKLFIRFFVAC